MVVHNEKDLYTQLSEERKAGQEAGEIPDWMTTGGYQLMKSKYLPEGVTIRQRHSDIAAAAAQCAHELYGETKQHWKDIFFNMIWSGDLSPSTPVLANMSELNQRGCNVSCSGGYVPDSVQGFYDARREVALLTKNGFGTSSYMGDIRPRGSVISTGGHSTGVLPVFKGFVQDMRDVSQGSTRRGAWAGYIDVEHKDFWEVADYLFNNPDDLNIGWNISDKFITKCDSGDEESLRIWKRILKIRAVTGKGYLFFVDKANELAPAMYKDLCLEIKASNLCSEIMLTSDKYHTFTCILSSLNLRNYDRWRNTDTVNNATIFLDCVTEHFIKHAKNIIGLDSAVRFTEKSRALGLGVLGFHSYLQDKMIAFESLDAHMKNIEMFKTINEKSLAASKWMASIAGEPEWCKGYGVRNTHRIAIAPTMSTATIVGGVSQGIEPFVGNAFNQGSAAGEISRVNPSLLQLMKDRMIYNKSVIDDIINHGGSVQHVDWLSNDEKLVFKTAFEINQETIIRMASARGKFIDQGQSLNLFFDANEEEAYVSQIHKLAAKDPYIKALYYMRSMAGVQASKGECIACEG